MQRYTIPYTKLISGWSDAPGAVGPYSQAIKAGNLVFVSGNIPLNPATKKVEVQDIESQAKQALANLKAVVEASGSTVNKVVKTTVCSPSFLPITSFQIRLDLLKTSLLYF